MTLWAKNAILCHCFAAKGGDLCPAGVSNLLVGKEWMDCFGADAPRNDTSRFPVLHLTHNLLVLPERNKSTEESLSEMGNSGYWIAPSFGYRWENSTPKHAEALVHERRDKRGVSV
jgi:hypothetical protein